MDECGIGTASCDPNSDCVDTDGSYDCICRAGYTGDGRLSCAGMLDTFLEDESLKIVVHSGLTSYKGQLLLYNYYTDINECETPGDFCDINADCINMAGSYDCVCKAGYSGDGSSCQSKKSHYYYCLKLIQ